MVETIHEPTWYQGEEMQEPSAPDSTTWVGSKLPADIYIPLPARIDLERLLCKYTNSMWLSGLPCQGMKRDGELVGFYAACEELWAAFDGECPDDVAQFKAYLAKR